MKQQPLKRLQEESQSASQKKNGVDPVVVELQQLVKRIEEMDAKIDELIEIIFERFPSWDDPIEWGNS